ncbi:Hypothetical protein NocV09_03300020 [Nannochloropsis oceanica]
MADHDLLQQQEQPSAPSPASRHHPTHRIRRRYRRSWDRHGLLAASALCAAFGVGYQAVPIAGWLQYFLLLRFLEVGRRRLRLWVVMWLVRALGWTLALAGSFNNPSFTLSGLVSVLVVCLVISAMETLAAALYVVIGDRYPKRVHAKVLAYPIMMTAFWFFWSLVSPTGSYGHPALCNWPISSIIQLTSLFGLEGILFLMTWTASVLSVALNLLFSPSPFPPSLPPSSHHSRPSDGALEEHEKHGPYYEDGEEEGGEEEGEGEEGEEGGLSGYWDSTYTPYALSYTSFKTRTVFSQVTVPRPQSRPTLFSWVGFVFGWLCLAVACGYIIVILGPGEKAMRLAAGRFRRGVGRRSSGSIGGREGGKMEREALVRQRRR